VLRIKRHAGLVLCWLRDKAASLGSTIHVAAAAAARHDHPLFETLAGGNVHCGDLYQPSVNGEGNWLVLHTHSPHTGATYCLPGTTSILVSAEVLID
jgi:hypothetical protein